MSQSPNPIYNAPAYRDYARQRQMTLSDLLLENRIVFLGSSPETGGNPAITDYLANITIQKLLFLQYENKNQEIHMSSTYLSRFSALPRSAASLLIGFASGMQTVIVEHFSPAF